MRKIIILIFFLSTGLNAQINPILNLTWQQEYDFGYYDYLLQWDEPASPHDELVGYNVYRDNELFQFQTENYLTTYGVNPNGDQDFMSFESDGDGFYVNVRAVYGPNALESDFTQSVLVENNLLGVNDRERQRINLHPNPTTGKIYIVAEHLAKIRIYDLPGKKVAEFEAISELDLQNLNKGIYIIELIDQNETSVFKKIILK